MLKNTDGKKQKVILRILKRIVSVSAMSSKRRDVYDVGCATGEASDL